MIHSVLLLSVLLPLPNQAPRTAETNQPAKGIRPPGSYLEDQRALDRIREDIGRFQQDELTEIMALNDQVAQLREQEACLLERLAILRQSARSADAYCFLRLQRVREWDELHQRHFDPAIHKLFHTVVVTQDIVKRRALVRKLFYMEIMYHRWSGETQRKGINYRIVEGLGVFCPKGDSEVVLTSLGWADVFVTDAWPLLRWFPARP